MKTERRGFFKQMIAGAAAFTASGLSEAPNLTDHGYDGGQIVPKEFAEVFNASKPTLMGHPFVISVRADFSTIKDGDIALSSLEEWMNRRLLPKLSFRRQAEAFADEMKYLVERG